MLTFLAKLFTGGHIKDLLGFIKDMVEMLHGNREKNNVREYNEAIATKEQFGKEFSYGASYRTTFDSIIDGLNRLPRPVITFGVIALFWWAFASPEHFQISMQAMNQIPAPMWNALYMILGLYFTARTAEKIALPKPQPTQSVSAAPKPKATTGNKSIDDFFESQN